MINASQAWHRIKTLAAFKGKKEADFRSVAYVQTFTVTAGAASAMLPQVFPGGGIILGITASAYIPSAAGTAQGNRNRQLFGLEFQFTNNEQIVVAGPALADALLGGGDADIFPTREMIIEPTQQINCRATNYTTGNLVIHVVYHTLVYRYAA